MEKHPIFERIKKHVHIDYCVNIWSCTGNTNLQPINVSMKKAIRLITFNKYTKS